MAFRRPRNRTRSGKKSGRKYFSRTAVKTNGRNNRGRTMRGGYRL